MSEPTLEQLYGPQDNDGLPRQRADVNCPVCGKPMVEGRREYPSHFYLYASCRNGACRMCGFERYLGQTLKPGYQYSGGRIVRGAEPAGPHHQDMPVGRVPER